MQNSLGWLLCAKYTEQASLSFVQRLRGFLSYPKKKKRKKNWICCLNITFPIDLTQFFLAVFTLKMCFFAKPDISNSPSLSSPFAPTWVLLEITWRNAKFYCVICAFPLIWVWSPSLVRRLAFSCIWSYIVGLLKATPISPGYRMLQVCLKSSGPWWICTIWAERCSAVSYTLVFI